MPVGILEIAIVAVILFVIFGYRYLPRLGRRAGESVSAVRGSVREAVGDKADPKAIGRAAGKGVRELREFRDAVTGKESPGGQSGGRPAPPAGDRREAAGGDGGDAAGGDGDEAVEGEIVEGDERSP